MVGEEGLGVNSERMSMEDVSPSPRPGGDRDVD